MTRTRPLVNASGSVVRPARPTDCDAILRMVAGLAAHHGEVATLTAEGLKRDVFCTSSWVDILVADDGTDLLGYAALYRLSQLQLGRRGMRLHHLFVEPRARGQGLGADLVRASLTRSKRLGCAYLVVEAHHDNVDAHRFYLGQGFQRRDANPARFRMQLDG